MVLDREGPRGEFAIYLDGEPIFSRVAVGRMPEPNDILPILQHRLYRAERTDDRPPAETV